MTLCGPSRVVPMTKTGPPPECQPDWTLLDVPGAAELPAVKWRQLNLDKLPAKKRAELVEALEKTLAK